MNEFKTIAQDGQIDIEIKKSRFLCFVKRVTTEAEVRESMAAIKKEHYKANHHCSAFILGEDQHIKRSSDDGEPSGTAGVPMLSVLENHNLTNLLVVVVRYFGGIKLGAGGLIRAYSHTVSEAIHTIGTVSCKEQASLLFSLSYAQYQDFNRWCQQHAIAEQQPIFLENVQTSIFVDEENIKETIAELTDYFQGKVDVEIGETRRIEIPLH